MPLALTVVPGHAFAAATAFDHADLNAAAKPSVTLSGTVAASDISAGAISPSLVSPGAYFYAADTTGATNAIVATLSPALGSLANGTVVYVKIRTGTTNTAACTLNVNGLGGVNVLRSGGAALRPGDIRANCIHQFQYNSSTPCWELINPANPDVRQCPSSSGTASAYTLVSVPVVTALYTGCRVAFKCHTQCDATPTLSVDGTTAKQLRKFDDTAIAALEIKMGQIVDAIYDAAANGAAGAWLVVGNIADLSTPAGALVAFHIPRVNAGATGTEWAHPPIIQMSVTQIATTSVTNGTTEKIPSDDTKPQNTEGKEYTTKAFTPLSATSRLLVEFESTVRASAGACRAVVALFQDAVADALATAQVTLLDNKTAGIRVVFDMVSGTTSEITFKIRFGPDDITVAEAIMMAANEAGPENFGDTLFSTFKITEYIA